MTNIYQGIYDLLNQYVFGNTIVEGSYQDLIVIILSTCACVFLVVLPFVVVWRIMRVFL